MKRPNKLEKIPVPISLSKKTIKLNTQQSKPYKIGWGSYISLEENCQSANIQNLKQQLNHMKSDVEKLFVASQNNEKLSNNQKSLVLQGSLKEEINKYKENQNQLKSKIEKLTLQLEEQKVVEHKKFEKKLEQAKKEWKSEKDRLVKVNNQLINKLKTLKEDFKKKIDNKKQIQEKLKQKEDELTQLRNNVKEQKQQECKKCQNRVKLEYQLNEKYKTTMNQLKKLEAKYQQYNSTQLINVKNDKKIIEQQLIKFKIKNNQLRQQNDQLNHKITNYKKQLNQYISNNHNLNNQTKQCKSQIYELQKQNQNLKKQIQYCSKQNLTISNTLKQKLLEAEKLINMYKSRQNSNSNNEQIKYYKVEIINKNIQIQRLIENNANLSQKINYLNQNLQEKQSYIQVLQNQSHIISNNPNIENRYRQIISELKDQKNQVIQNYEYQLSNMREELQKCSQQPKIKYNNDFDKILKQVLKQIQQLKKNLRDKNNQQFHLKNEIDQYRRKLDLTKNEMNIEKLKADTQIKNIKSNYEINFQCIRNQNQLLKKKIESIQMKLTYKNEQLRKKDDLIRNMLTRTNQNK